MDGITSNQSASGSTTVNFPADGFPAKRERETGDPHKTWITSYARFYVNDVGFAEALKSQPSFPAGTVIAREKLNKAEDVDPEVVTVMLKHEKGFSRKTGDWEYLIVSGDMRKVVKREKYGDCAACHSGAEKTDFVFNRYSR